MQQSIFIYALIMILLPACELIEDEPGGDTRDKYTGTWRFNEDDQKKTDLSFYNVLITKDPTNSSQVLLKNFGNLGNFYTTVGIATTNRISIENQSVASVLIQGSGSLSTTNRMSWTYIINDGADQITYTATAERI